MYALISILSVWIFVKTLSYGIYEIKQKKNKLGGISIFLLALFSLIAPLVMGIIRGIY